MGEFGYSNPLEAFNAAHNIYYHYGARSDPLKELIDANDLNAEYLDAIIRADKHAYHAIDDFVYRTKKLLEIIDRGEEGKDLIKQVFEEGEQQPWAWA